VSEREQVEAIKLLAEWLSLAPEEKERRSDLRERTKLFLKLSAPELPESHGQRRG